MGVGINECWCISVGWVYVPAKQSVRLSGRQGNGTSRIPYSVPSLRGSTSDRGNLPLDPTGLVILSEVKDLNPDC